jgi:hypothetical protein
MRASEAWLAAIEGLLPFTSPGLTARQIHALNGLNSLGYAGHALRHLVARGRALSELASNARGLPVRHYWRPVIREA